MTVSSSHNAEKLSRKTVLVLTGPTASGKKSVARLIASDLHAEILAMDSVKIYRGMNIGAAKGWGGEGPAHLIDLAEPTETFSTGSYLEAARRAVSEIRARGLLPLFVGGAGLYLFALLRGFFDGPAADAAVRERLRHEAAAAGIEHLHARLERIDPATAARVGKRDSRRIIRALEVFDLTGQPISVLRAERTRPPIDGIFRVAGLRWPRDELDARIHRRLREMFAGDFLDECRALLARGELAPEPRGAIGYREAFACLRGELDLEEAMTRATIATRRLARRQQTWFRQFPEIQWVDVDATRRLEDVAAEVKARLSP
ncbi:MAG: tRNA (adenosine(37)-N6)-dimethylallyltransferase MiaA [Planctomycetota bacterium]